MPYIKQEDRPKFEASIQDLAEKVSCAGDINYVVTKIVQLYLKKKGKNYANINEIIGALECCKLEAYRRIAAGYEDIKAIQNGDVKEVL
jgi:hypothetical protein